jgi:peptidyl-prolyl cis-trans isomerase SurA
MASLAAQSLSCTDKPRNIENSKSAPMNVLKRLIPVVMMAIPLFGVAANEKDSVAVGSVIDEVIWVVGDEAILRSDVESMRMQAALEGMKWSGNPDCIIPEQIAVQKLFKHQAAIDSIEVTDADVAQEVEQQINYWLDMVDGSRERLEEYKHQPLSQIRNELRDEMKDRQMVQRMKRKLVEDISVTPAEVRRYFKDMPQDSIPFVPTEVEVQIIQMTPRIEIEELNRVKDELRDYTDRVNKGEASFQTLARLYSEDPGTSRRGGEVGLAGRGTLDPAFATVAFNLTDPKKVSKIVESEFGFHIIQLIEKRGEKVNVRHILRKPVVSEEAVERALGRLDSIADDIRAGKFTFEEAAPILSDDKDTKNSKGLMSTNMMQTGHTSSRFQMQDLPPEIAKVVDTLKVGEISKSFQMINQRGKTVCVIAKLKNRIEGHKATMTEDFQVLKDVVQNKRQEECIHQWVVDKIKNVYTRLNDDYKDCQFEFEGWIK